MKDSLQVRKFTSPQVIGLFVLLILCLGGLPAQAQAVKLIAKFVDQELSSDPAALIWAQAEPVTITLFPQQIALPFGGGAISELQARALHNGRMIAFLIEWADATLDNEAAQTDKFSDAVAVQFPVDPTTTPSPFMGDTHNAVNIWQWQAAWQRDIDEGGLADVERVYPPYSDVYVDERMRERGELSWRPGEAVGNWRSQRARTTPVENLMAQGWGTLTTQALPHVLGQGVWENGRWRLVFLRALQTGLAGDAPFVPGRKSSINFAVWDGSNQERGARKSVSLVWHELELQAQVAPPAATTPTAPPKEVVRVVGVPGWVAAAIGVLALLFGGIAVWLIRRPRPYEPEIG